MPLTTQQLSPDEYATFYATYIDKVPPGQPLADALRVSQHCLDAWLEEVTVSGADYAYAEGKWSVAQVVQHLIDSERVFAYRALWIARGGKDPLPGFDQDAFVQAAPERPDFGGLRDELRQLRTSSLAMFATFHEDSLMRRGVASGAGVSVRAQGFIMAGHSYHHAALYAERYGGALLV